MAVILRYFTEVTSFRDQYVKGVDYPVYHQPIPVFDMPNTLHYLLHVRLVYCTSLQRAISHIGQYRNAVFIFISLLKVETHEQRPVFDSPGLTSLIAPTC